MTPQLHWKSTQALGALCVLGALQSIYVTEGAATKMTEADVRRYLDETDILAYDLALQKTYELSQSHDTAYRMNPEFKHYDYLIDLLHAKAATVKNGIKHATLRATATDYEQVRPKPHMTLYGNYDTLYELQSKWEQDAAAWRREQAHRLAAQEARMPRYGYGFK